MNDPAIGDGDLDDGWGLRQDDEAAAPLDRYWQITFTQNSYMPDALKPPDFHKEVERESQGGVRLEIGPLCPCSRDCSTAA